MNLLNFPPSTIRENSPEWHQLTGRLILSYELLELLWPDRTRRPSEEWLLAMVREGHITCVNYRENAMSSNRYSARLTVGQINRFRQNNGLPPNGEEEQQA